MTLEHFLAQLELNRGKILSVEYYPNTYSEIDFHITEVKNCKIQSVDCGGKQHQWTEVIIQLWEDPNPNREKRKMRVTKAIQVLKRVQEVQYFDPQATLKIEYGNARFHTANQKISAMVATEQKLILQLGEVASDCKAKDVCGVEIQASAVQESCAPGSGCC
tara:strand:+ start:12620 stop:13105 length:486 start_codon:yes stop_codon:yes gene_type:complete